MAVLSAVETVAHTAVVMVSLYSVDPFFTHTFLVTPVLAILFVVTAGCFVAEAQHSPVLQIYANCEPDKSYDEHSLPGVAVD